MSMNTPAFTMVDECRSALVGVGATHSAQQPGVERHLRRFGHARKAQARKREYHERRRERADDDEVEEIDGVEFEHHEEERSQKGDAADHVHDDLTERIRDRFLSAGVADEEEGANCGDLPTGIEPDEIVAEDDRIHRARKMNMSAKKRGRRSASCLCSAWKSSM